ncbi:hypothetical protein CPC08DRAFT_705525 [Agrocybe pediades]|nr:hypothetical protein CPC08DRAFT_705525 [Agrocybe pediades]
MITLYDIPSRLVQKAWSPNVWKTRYCLNFKQLPYRTEWVEYPDIELKSKELGVRRPSLRRPNGAQAYTLPVIRDSNTGTSVADSFKIAEYLDRTYPNPQRMIFPHNTAGIQAPFARSFAANMSPIMNLIIPPECDMLNPRSAEWFSRTRVEIFGLAKLEDMLPKSSADYKREWAKVQDGLTKSAKWFAKNERGGPFIMGPEPCWADFVVRGYLMWMRCVWGEESEHWRDVLSWDDGRWAKFVDGLKKYENVV